MTSQRINEELVLLMLKLSSKLGNSFTDINVSRMEIHVGDLYYYEAYGMNVPDLS